VQYCGLKNQWSLAHWYDITCVQVWQSSRAKFLRSKASSTFRSTMRTSVTGTMTKKPPTSYAMSSVRSSLYAVLNLCVVTSFQLCQLYSLWALMIPGLL